MAEQTSAERLRQANRAADRAAVEELLADMRSRRHLLIPEYIDRLKVALAKAALPLEVLNADNYVGAKWMAPEVRQSITEAVLAIREALKDG